MIYLSTGCFKPMFILVSIVFLPLSIACWILTVADFRIELLISSLLLSLIYFAIVFGVYKYSKTKKYYMLVKDGCIVVNYYNLHCSEIELNNVVKMEYYKISSIRAWCMVFNSVGPQCVYITYLCDGKEVCEHIGFPDFNEISRLCIDIGVDLVVK